MNDGAKYLFECKWALTCEGEPIALNEYCLQIAAIRATHALLFEDFLSDMGPVICKQEYTHPEAYGVGSFKELDIEDKSHRDCLHYYPRCDMTQLVQLITQAKQQDQAAGFLFPDFLTSKIIYMPFKNI